MPSPRPNQPPRPTQPTSEIPASLAGVDLRNFIPPGTPPRQLYAFVTTGSVTSVSQLAKDGGISEYSARRILRQGVADGSLVYLGTISNPRRDVTPRQEKTETRGRPCHHYLVDGKRLTVNELADLWEITPKGAWQKIQRLKLRRA